MIITLSNSEYSEYSTHLIILLNNFKTDEKILHSEKYINALYEILKTIDYNIFTIEKNI